MVMSVLGVIWWSAGGLLRDWVCWSDFKCPVMAAGVVVVDYCELCALRPREHACLLGSIEHGWLAGWHVHGPPSWTESACCMWSLQFCLRNRVFFFLQTSTSLDNTTTPGCLQLQACLVLEYTGKHTPSHSCPLPNILRDDISEFCNANGSSLPLSGGGYETRCGLT